MRGRNGRSATSAWTYQGPLRSPIAGRDRDALADQPVERAVPSGRTPVERPADLSRRCHAPRTQLPFHHATSDRRRRRSRSPHRQASLGQIPEPELSVPARDHDFAARPEELEHHRRRLALIVPPAGLPPLDGTVLQVARAERTAAPELAQDVPSERRVGGHPLAPVHPAPRLSGNLPPEPSHRLAMDVVVVDRHDVGPVLEERVLVPQHPFEVGHAEPRAQPAPQHEVLGPSDSARRIHLDLAQPAHDLLDRSRLRSRQHLADDGEAPRLFTREDEWSRTHVSEPSPSCWSAG